MRRALQNCNGCGLYAVAVWVCAAGFAISFVAILLVFFGHAIVLLGGGKIPFLVLFPALLAFHTLLPFLASGGLVFVYDKLVQCTLSILDIAAGAAALANSLALFHYFFGFFLALLPTFAMNTLMQCILLAVCNLTTLCIIHARL